MIEDQEIIDWITGQLSAKHTWLERFSEGRDRRGALEISQKINDIKMLTEIRERIINGNLKG